VAVVWRDGTLTVLPLDAGAARDVGSLPRIQIEPVERRRECVTDLVLAEGLR
jgi:hypothetical protein